MNVVESNEVITVLPSLAPELIVAILWRENIAALDSRTDSKSAAGISLPAQRSQRAVSEKNRLRR